MDEDDLEYAPPDEKFVIADIGGLGAVPTRAMWAQVANQSRAPLKPPPWWLDHKDLEGQGKAKFKIWNSRYDQDRRISKWLVAPLEDFRRAGYLVKR